MKKSIIRALCLVLTILSVALALGCAAGGKHTYDNILDTYRQLLTKAQNGESIPADGEDDVLNALYAIARTCEPAEMGYATCDFDGNGEDELLLLSSGYCPVALFTSVDGEAQLLMRWIENDKVCRGTVTEGGTVCRSVTNGSLGWSIEVKTIEQGTTLRGIEFGAVDTTPDNTEDQRESVEYYQILDGERTVIDQMTASDTLPYQYDVNFYSMRGAYLLKNTGARYVPAIGKPTSPGEDAVAADFSSYDAILATYRHMVAQLDQFTSAAWCTDALDAGYIFADDSAYATYVRLFPAIYSQRPTTTYFGDKLAKDWQNAYGYALRDLNGDGTEELILMTDVYDLIAIFTVKDDTPVLLTTLNGWIDENGEMHFAAERNGGGVTGRDHSRLLYRVGDGVLETVFEIGCTYDYTLSPDYCYKIENGTEIEITLQEFEALNARYESVPSGEGWTERAYMRAVSGLTFSRLNEVPRPHKDFPTSWYHPYYYLCRGLDITDVSPDGNTLTFTYCYDVIYEGNKELDRVIELNAQRKDGIYVFESKQFSGTLEFCADGIWMHVTDCTLDTVKASYLLFNHDDD